MILVWLFIAIVHAGSGDEKQPNLVLISIDTLRADAVSSYGSLPDLEDHQVNDVTPNIDALASAGLRFKNFYTHAPTTLNAHTTMMSGLDPHAHGVPRNGYPLPEGLQLLSNRLSGVGFNTIGVVGAKALEKEMGLSRGFDVYDDTTPTKLGPMFQDTADGVVDRAFQHLDTVTNAKPTFLFVHFYDAHTPYKAPEPYHTRFCDPEYAGPFTGDVNSLGPLKRDLRKGKASPEDIRQVAGLYLGEVSFVDSQIGRLLHGLSERGFLSEAVVVITADHGEELSGDPTYAYGHGSDVSDAVTRIPLIIWSSGDRISQGVVERHASLSGLASTLEMLLDLPPTLNSPQNFYRMVRPGPVYDTEGWPERPIEPIFSEATRPRQKEPEIGWNNGLFARSLRLGDFTLFHRPLLWSEPRLIEGDARLAPVMKSMLREWDEQAPPHRDVEMSDSTTAALKALGYLDD